MFGFGGKFRSQLHFVILTEGKDLNVKDGVMVYRRNCLQVLEILRIRSG